ncbi:hypothetical protein ABID29_001639 [Streptococcus rupicaprae]|uniref:Pre-toxin TG domain-containing protein n=1 Tax=Streptococcus rupicaprae TaxID=759619 RepID=A0ABV2FJ01_9STRE
MSGKPETLAELERYFYTKLESDERLKEYFYKNLTSDSLLKTYFASEDALDLPEVFYQRASVEDRKLKAYFYQTLQRDKFFRDYFYKSADDEVRNLEEVFVQTGTSFYQKVQVERWGVGKKPTAPKPSPQPTPIKLPYAPPAQARPAAPVYTPPVSSPTFTASNPTPATKPAAKPTPKPVRRPSSSITKKPSTSQTDGSKTIRDISSGNTSAIPKLIKQAKDPKNLPTRELISSTPTGVKGQTLNTYQIDFSAAGIGTIVSSSYYKHGKPDVKANNKHSIDSTLKVGEQLALEYLGVNDAYRVIAGKDPVTGDKANRLAAAGWLAASVVPGSKLLKGADTAHDVTKAVGTINRTTSTIKSSHAAVTAAKSTKGATVGTWVAKGGEVAFDTGRTLKTASTFIKQADGRWKAADKVGDVSRPINAIDKNKKLVKADDIVFSDKFKLPNYKNQPAQRGWTNQKIADTINNPTKTSTSINKATGNTVTNYYVNDIHYVAVDDVTKKVIQIADLNDLEWLN